MKTWLVVEPYPSEKYDESSVGIIYYSQYMEKYHVQTTNQYEDMCGFEPWTTENKTGVMMNIGERSFAG